MIETARDTTGPLIKQISFFLENRVGALLSVVRKLEEENIHICAISIVDAADHAVIRMVVNRPSLAVHALHKGGIQVFHTELLGVELPSRGGSGSGRSSPPCCWRR